MTLTVYRHPKKDQYGRFVYDYSIASGLDGILGRSLLKRDDEEKAILSLKDYIASARKTTNFSIKIVEKDFIVY